MESIDKFKVGDVVKMPLSLETFKVLRFEVNSKKQKDIAHLKIISTGVEFTIIIKNDNRKFIKVC